MVLYQSRHDAAEYGRLAQLVEHLLDVQEVTGSSPVPSTTKILRLSSEDFLFVVGGTGREPERAKAGYHYGSGILPFAILNRVWYTRLSSTNLHLED